MAAAREQFRGEAATRDDLHRPAMAPPRGDDDTDPVPPVELHTPEWVDKMRLIARYDELGPKGRRVLVDIAERLVAGKRAYGDDFERKRNWQDEAREELLDACVYLTVKMTEGEKS